jgi:hypothetical protein
MKIDITESNNTIKYIHARNIIYLFLFLFFLIVYLHWPKNDDLYRHSLIVADLKPNRLLVPHFLYHLVVLAISRISGLSFIHASCFVAASCVTVSTFLIEQILRHFLKGKYSDLFLLFISLALMSVSSIYLPLFIKDPYLGVWSPNPWHSPTYLAAKPFVLLSFYLYILEIAKVACFDKRFSLMRISILLVICTLINPNFIIAFIPASMIFCLLQHRRKPLVLIKTGQLLSPVLMVLFFQYLYTYYYGTRGSSSIQFCFFDIWKFYSRSVPLAILQATAFSLSVLIVMRHRLSSDNIILFSWMLFIISFLMFGLLSETGGRRTDANFAWTYMYGLNILFISSTISFWDWIADMPKQNRVFSGKDIFM